MDASVRLGSMGSFVSWLIIVKLEIIAELVSSVCQKEPQVTVLAFALSAIQVKIAT